MITEQARAWVVHLACSKPKELGYAAELFPEPVSGVIGGCPYGVAHDLAHYAKMKLSAMEKRAAGDLNTATIYERICERIYSNLPEYARW